MSSRLAADFIEMQKQRLLARRSDLAETTRKRREEMSADNVASQGEAREYEDDAQHLTELELNGEIGQSIGGQRAQSDRALEKIAQGTYGYSDLSGEPIEVGRLRALPEALYTLQEQRSRDTGSQPRRG
jgi:DnaK suppressor protein